MMVLDIRSTDLPGVIEIVTKRHGDERGFFTEVWNRDAWAAAGIAFDIVQDNHSRSERAGVVRGLHYQLPPMAQDKIVRVTRGAIFDVAVDIRRSSPTFGQWIGMELSESRGNQLLVPSGFAHGFMTLQPGSEVQYKVNAPYSPEHERAIRYDDPAIGIDWPAIGGILLSAADQNALAFADAEVFA
jgi:dTDP-4-dehydrorhamnose 3,5-epimerase